MEKIKEIPIGSKKWLEHGQTVSLPKSWAIDVHLGKDEKDKIIVYRSGKSLILVPAPKGIETRSYTLYRDDPEDEEGLFEKMLSLLNPADKENMNSLTICNGDITFSEAVKCD